MSKKKPEQSKIDKAFTGSDEHTIGGEKLFPWTPKRSITAQRIGMIQPNLSHEGWLQWKRNQLYPGAVSDTIIFVYLSKLEDEKLALANYDDAEKMGIKMGLDKSGSKEFWDAYSTFLMVLNEIQAAATKPKDSPGAGTDEEEDDEHPNE